MSPHSSSTAERERRGGVARPERRSRKGAHRLLREPLVLFLLAGAALFAGYRATHPDLAPEGASHRIVLTPDDLRQMSVAWLAQGRPVPTPEQMRRLIDARVREEILYREALALGLDRDDTIVRRRMVQKMEFLAQDLSELREPTREELEAWFRDNAVRFVEPERRTFHHLYFSPDRRGATVREAAAAALAQLGEEQAGAPPPDADPFMFQDYYPERTVEQLAKDFGPGFAEALFTLAPGSWQGPIGSGFGWHLVQVDSVIPARMPTLEEVEPAVRRAWVGEQREELERKAFEWMRARYEVVLPASLTPEPLVGTAAAAGSGVGHGS